MTTVNFVVIETRLTVAQAAVSAGVSETTIHRWLKGGTLAHTKTQTGRVRIEPDDLRATLSVDVKEPN